MIQAQDLMSPAATQIPQCRGCGKKLQPDEIRRTFLRYDIGQGTLAVIYIVMCIECAENRQVHAIVAYQDKREMKVSPLCLN